MTLLLDTHVWLWAVEAPEKLGRRTKALLQKSSNDRLVSAISVLEIARLCMDQSIIFSISPKTWIEASAPGYWLPGRNRSVCATRSFSSGSG
jgi:PIN domain nuclease of toxin-antitoxin system